MEDQYTISEAKTRLPALIHLLDKGPIIKLTRHGRPVAVLISIQEYERLVQRKTGFWDKLSEFRCQKKVQQSEISDKDFEGLRDDSCGRDVEWS